MVTNGKDKGKTGIVQRVLRKDNRLIVGGLNLVKKFIKNTPQQKGGIVSKEAPIPYSTLSLIHPTTG
jgi:large subunit ribosomal protein L24